MHPLMLGLAVAGYLLASLGFARAAARMGEVAERRFPVGLLALAFVVHSLDLAMEIHSAGVLPVATFTGSFSLFAWLVVGVFLVLQVRQQVALVGVLVGPLAFLATAGDLLRSGDDAAVPLALRSPWLTVHVLLALLGNAVFALAFAVSAAFLLQQSLLRSRRGGAVLHRLPPVQTLDRLSLVFLLWGFPLLTLGMVTGGFWSMASTGLFWTGETREILAAITWVLYASLLQLRLIGGLHGRKAAWWTIAAFLLLLGSYLVVNLLHLGQRHGAQAMGMAAAQTPLSPCCSAGLASLAPHESREAAITWQATLPQERA